MEVGWRQAAGRAGSWLGSAERGWVWLSFWGIPVVNWIWLFCFYAYWLRVRSRTGRWPLHINDHGGLDGSWHNRTLWTVLPFLALGTLSWTTLLMFAPGLSARYRTWWLLAPLAVAWLAPGIVMLWDPRGLFVIFCD